MEWQWNFPATPGSQLGHYQQQQKICGLIVGGQSTVTATTLHVLFSLPDRILLYLSSRLTICL